MRRTFTLLLAVVALAVFSSGCARQKFAQPIDPDVSVGVAGFTQPLYDWQLLAGFIPEERKLVDEETLTRLDFLIMSQLGENSRGNVRGPAVTRQCQEVTLFSAKGERTSALDYWVEVGRCIPVDYLLVPMLFDYRDREGKPMGVVSPASVFLEFYVVDVREGDLISRYRFDETQQSLSDNLLDANRFFARGGKWLTADELAMHGIREGLRELGL